MEITASSGPGLTDKNELTESYVAGDEYETQSGEAPRAAVVRAAAPKKFITFFLNGENYAIDITRVHEIVIAPEITPVPNTPFYIMGVINLRGNIIQIIDMRLKLSMPFRNYDEKNCVIIIKTGHSLTGIVVDRVMEVISEWVEKIEEQPAFGYGVDTSYIEGILKSGGKTIFILNIEAIFGNCDN
jgi:purine-binding chemotaxis protein CheW